MTIRPKEILKRYENFVSVSIWWWQSLSPWEKKKKRKWHMRARPRRCFSTSTAVVKRMLRFRDAFWSKMYARDGRFPESLGGFLSPPRRGLIKTQHGTSRLYPGMSWWPRLILGSHNYSQRKLFHPWIFWCSLLLFFPRVSLSRCSCFREGKKGGLSLTQLG
jgi:hypothetical protein